MTTSCTVRSMLPISAAVLALALATAARAEDEGWGGEEAAEEEPPASSVPAAEGEKSESTEPETELSAPPADEAPEVDAEQSGAAEGSGSALGLRYRGLFLPKPVLGLFIDGGESVYVNGFGPQFAIRDDDVEYIFSAWLSLYDMNAVPIKGSSDDEYSWEIVESDMKAVYVTADYLWHTRLARSLELSYGGGAGLGFLFGDLYRTQATLGAGGTAGDPDDYVPCAAESVTDPYCDDFNDHYGGYTEPSWFGGGAKPVLFPWLSGQIGLRYQPHERVITRLDLGIGTSGLYFGVGADYSL